MGEGGEGVHTHDAFGVLLEAPELTHQVEVSVRLLERIVEGLLIHY